MSNILYSERGENGKNSLQDIDLAYLNMPIMVKYYITDKLGVSTGINWDALLSVDADELDKDDFKNSDWGIPIVISYNVTRNLQL